MASAASVSTTTSSSSDKSAASEALSTALAASYSASPPSSCSSLPGSTEKKGPGSPIDEDNPFNNLTRTPEQVIYLVLKSDQSWELLNAWSTLFLNLEIK